MNNLIPRAPKRKKQPTAECMRQQLALAADEIIRLRTMLKLETDLRKAFNRGLRGNGHSPQQPAWWRRIFPRKPA